METLLKIFNKQKNQIQHLDSNIQNVNFFAPQACKQIVATTVVAKNWVYILKGSWSWLSKCACREKKSNITLPQTNLKYPWWPWQLLCLERKILSHHRHSWSLHLAFPFFLLLYNYARFCNILQYRIWYFEYFFHAQHNLKYWSWKPTGL